MALYAMPTPREHIEEIRKEKFLIGSEKVHRILEEFHGTVELLSDELYAKDVHFFMELIQNAEDNEYQEGVDPSLEFVITSRDITGTGAPATLLMFNNEIGFSAKNIESICSFAKSTKKGNRKRGYIGEKVLEWVERIPSHVLTFQKVVVPALTLTATILILPLKRAEHPRCEQGNSQGFILKLLMFLSKIKRLYVREVMSVQGLNTVSWL
ncbi:hypothetical protein CUMW_115590 [Citrus unshiu]|uniref:Uncharacterized protein n=1 Tax=Citrus unshiu TaxID=55188 RepID=A0A2H5P9D0_CITUN|nr:hypothetical protein CUMW_115590 [Citrus unshiu]